MKYNNFIENNILYEKNYQHKKGSLKLITQNIKK